MTMLAKPRNSKNNICGTMISENRGIKPDCPHCGAKASLGYIIKKGDCKGSQRYLCKECKKYFVPTTKTAFSKSRKDADTWRHFIKLTISGESLHTCAEECNIAYQTAFTWRHKILNAFVVNQNATKMKGTIEVDEMLLPISYKGNHVSGAFGRRVLEPGMDNGLPRKGYERGTDNRTISSKEKACIFCMVENGNKGYYASVPGVGFMNDAMLDNTVGEHVDKDNAIMLADNYRVTQNYFENNGYIHLALASNVTNNPNDHKPEVRDGKHLQHVNAMHHHLRQFLSGYSGVSSKYLENYVALYVWLKSVGGKKRTADKISIARVSEPDCYITRSAIENRPAVPKCA